jgi:hypothetical protein
LVGMGLGQNVHFSGNCVISLWLAHFHNALDRIGQNEWAGTGIAAQILNGPQIFIPLVNF